MARYNISVNKSWRNRLVRLGVVLVSIVLIVWFLPRSVHHQLQYEANAPWKSDLLMAKYGFAIKKSNDVIAKEKDSLSRIFQPYYKFNKYIGEARLKTFAGDFKDGMPDIPAQYKPMLAERLSNIYAAGVLDNDAYEHLSKNQDQRIRIIQDGDTLSRRINFVISKQLAYELLLEDERLEPVADQLEKLDLGKYVEANLIYEKELSEAELDSLLATVRPLTNDSIQVGQKIIDRGDMVDAERDLVLQSYLDVLERNTSLEQRGTTLLGQLLYVALLVTLFTFYLALFRKDYFYNPRAIAMLYALLTMFPIVVSLMMKHSIMSVYLLPFAMVPIFVRVFMDSRTAYFTHVVMILICAIAVGYRYEFIIIQLVAGVAAIYSLRELSSRSQLFKTAIIVTMASVLVYFALQLIQIDKVDKLGGDMYKYFFVNGVLLLLAYPLMLIIERLFGFISSVSLIELSDTNKGALRELSEVAPGTFQHSVTVGNLAAEIARRIGANALLVRTGAFYHDIGKITDPYYFTENQTGVSPHDNMPYTESSRKIISHVTEGVRIADRYRLPQFIKDFILTHHGTGLTKYFYIKYKNEHPDEDVDQKLFSYPGPNPFTREQAILMMADGVEAASRSLAEYTEKSISELVDRLVDGMVQAGYFADCPITFLDIKLAKQVLVERLKALYHTRIAYPSEKEAAGAASV